MEAATSRLLLRRAVAPAALSRAVGDRALVDRARDGDSNAFEAIYSRYHAEILWFCRRKLRSREDAEDAAQNTFAVAYRELLSSPDPIELRPWLYGIARHRCLMVLRARRAEVDPLQEDFPAGEDAADEVVRRQDMRELFLDLGELPDRQRSALLLSEVGGLSHAQIASRLQCRPNQVKALVFQARSSLTDSRSARGAVCAEIRQELASARGAARLRRHLRRHVSACPGCKQFEAAVKRERSAVALGLSLFPGLGPGVLAALGGAARLRLAQLLANVPFAGPISSGGWRWAAAVTAAAAATGGGVAAIEVSGHPAAGSSLPAGATLARAWAGGSHALPRLTGAPSWAVSPAGRRGAVSAGATSARWGWAAGAVKRHYARRSNPRRTGSATQTLTALFSLSSAGATIVAGASTPAAGSAHGPRSVSPASGSAGSSTGPDHGASPGRTGPDHPSHRGSPGGGTSEGSPPGGSKGSSSGGSQGSPSGGSKGSSSGGSQGSPSGGSPKHGDPGQGGGGPPQDQAGSAPGQGSSHGGGGGSAGDGGGGGGGSSGAGQGNGHGPPPGHGATRAVSIG